METNKLISKVDNLELSVAEFIPNEGIEPKGIVLFSHGMAEHKERYFPFMEYLSEHGYITVIHDHRGHGESVKSKDDLGFFYSDTPESVAEDLFQVVEYAKAKYPGLPAYIFSHSMGTLVARVLMQKHDEAVDKVVLCGPPTENKLAAAGVLVVKLNSLFFGWHHRSKFVNGMAFGGYTKKGEGTFSWLSADSENVKKYEEDELCGYLFTNNGFLNLFGLMQKSFDKSWKAGNGALPVHLIAGADDPVIQGSAKFNELLQFLGNVGYENVTSKLYLGLRHEILNEKEKDVVWADVLRFFEG